MPTFAEKLHEIRRERGITQEQLANAMNVSRPTISHWENGRVMPDIDTIKHLASLLNYNFFAVEGVIEDAQPGPGAEEAPNKPEGETVLEAPARPARPAACRRKLLLSAVLGAVALCVVLIACFLMSGSSSGACANISITSAENPVKAIRFEEFPDGVGWFYEFRIAETNGVPFAVRQATQTVYAENGNADRMEFAADQLAEIWGSSTLTQNIPQSWTGGFPHQPVKGVGLELKGTDANGNELEFTGYIELSKEIAE